MAWQTVLRYGKSFCTGFVVGLPIYITVTDFGFCIARVDGVSMQPSLNPVASESDIVFLNRWAVRNVQKVKRGDVVSLISPNEPDVKLIKRVVGLEGDIIKTLGYKKPYVLIPKGHCWIEGDHRGRSLDSNTFGPVSVGLINGLATHVLWPPKRWTKLESALKDDRIPVRKLPSYKKRELITEDRDISNENILQCPVMIKKQNAMLEKDVKEEVKNENETINKDMNERIEDRDSITIEDDD